MTAASKSGMSEELTEHDGRLETLEAAVLDLKRKQKRTRVYLILSILFVFVILTVDHHFTFHVLDKISTWGCSHEVLAHHETGGTCMDWLKDRGY
jgi:hypothetical protein